MQQPYVQSLVPKRKNKIFLTHKTNKWSRAANSFLLLTNTHLASAPARQLLQGRTRLCGQGDHFSPGGCRKAGKPGVTSVCNTKELCL